MSQVCMFSMEASVIIARQMFSPIGHCRKVLTSYVYTVLYKCHVCMLEDMSRRHKRQPVNSDRVGWTLAADATCVGMCTVCYKVTTATG